MPGTVLDVQFLIYTKKKNTYKGTLFCYEPSNVPRHSLNHNLYQYGIFALTVNFAKPLYNAHHTTIKIRLQHQTTPITLP